MKKFLLGLLVLLSFTVQAQYQKGGVMVVGGVAVMQLDTNTRNIIKIIEDERVAGGGALFTTAEKQYVNIIVTNLKAIGVWDKCKAVYGFVGGTADSHKWNWKDMRDLDVAYRLSFLGGGWIHNSSGAKPNGTSSYANTFLSINYTSGIPDDIFLAYSTNENTANIATESVMGDYTSGSQSRLIIKRSNGFGYSLITNSSAIAGNQYLMPSNISGISIANKKGSTSDYFLNGVKLIGTNTLQTSDIKPLTPITIGAVQPGSGQNTDKRCNMSMIGEGLTDIQAIQTSNIVTFAQGILSRK